MTYKEISLVTSSLLETLSVMRIDDFKADDKDTLEEKTKQN